ncbi:2-oxoacid:acceptor oxidoreductase subunit alpha [Proteiniclasticum sp. SCR006]|uniref:2-oxoacid:acceptor oxidoreductase subunit alpha n=1 Tax=Proteiniclasticum aestuarii TaxID=2817862 RepID=A0A939KID2_9CLOT|nr:2-oxoacid:acceptor oxidoreductase subunit alpha [Proteiniclasticum aestuarii]MBO1263836.1 2-oxoacid:acceptor oxidoreductase subunit alpha [Proteiniclasticum aestuarii]
MNFNLLIGGAAGQGMETLSSNLSKILQRRGYHLFTLQDYMSRVRGGHNFFQIRFSENEVKTHRDDLDGIIALNQETVDLHIGRLNPDGFIIADEDVRSDDKRLITIPAKKIAKELGNPKVQSSVILGALLKIYGMDVLHLEDILSKKFNEKVVNQNIEAFEKGHDLETARYEEPETSKEPTMLVQANESIALGALAAGMKFYSAYPMTPATSIMSYLVKKSIPAKVVVEQAEDEIAAINMAIGASYAGVRAMTGTSGGGYSLMVEAVGMAGITETPLVIAEIQRPGPATGLPTRTEQSDLKFVINSSHGEFPKMVIALRHPEDAFYQTARAFNLADKYQIPIILLGDQYMADAVRTVTPFDLDKITIERHLADEEIYRNGKEYKRYELTENGISPRLVPGKVEGTMVNSDSDEHDEAGNITEASDVRINMVEKRAKKLELLKEELLEPDFMGEEDADVLLLGWGSLHSQLSEAIDLLNATGDKKFGALVFGDIWPLPEKLLRAYQAKAKVLVNVEQNYTGQLADLISEVTGIRVDHSVLKYDGRPLSATEIKSKVLEVLS